MTERTVSSGRGRFTALIFGAPALAGLAIPVAGW